MTEYDFTKKIESFLLTQEYQVYFEIPNMGQSMDIFAQRNGFFTAIEVKLSDWRRGLAQCKAHELVCDYICLSIATKNISETLQLEIQNRGYGLIHYNIDDGECVWVVEPKRNNKIWNAQRNLFCRNIRGVENV